MTNAPVLRIYLDPEMRERALRGDVGIIARIEGAFRRCGFRTEIRGDTVTEKAISAVTGGYHLFHMNEPIGGNTLVLRRAYEYPFWRIEATNERWNFDIAGQRFDPECIDPDRAAAFMRRRRKAIFGPRAPERRGFILMPLQGRITLRRSFQSMSPLEMIKATRKADPDRNILLRLHPNEEYPAADMRELRALIGDMPGFWLAKRPTIRLLAECDYVVTQNSSVAFRGFFAEKPAVVFSEIDFHHIAGSVPRQGVEAAFRAAQNGPRPDFARYLWWFLRGTAIDATADAAEDQILARVRRFGWPI